MTHKNKLILEGPFGIPKDGTQQPFNTEGANKVLRDKLATHINNAVSLSDQMLELSKKRVLLLGGTGFLGRAVQKVLNEHQVKFSMFGRGKYNLTVYEQTRSGFIDCKPQVVLNFAGCQGGIGFNIKHPGRILDHNVRMITNVFNACLEFDVEKIYSIIPSCSFPDVGVCIRENSLFNGPPNPSVFAHSCAKRLIQAYTQSYHDEYELNGATFGLTNLYGPHDNFTEDGKVVSGVIRKMFEAKNSNSPTVTFWGSGSPLRQFMFVDDAARALLNHLDYDDHTQPRNIGTPHEVSIKELVDTVASIIDYQGEIVWDGRPDGQMRKFLDISNMKDQEFTSLRDGLKITIDWYLGK